MNMLAIYTRHGPKRNAVGKSFKTMDTVTQEVEVGVVGCMGLHDGWLKQCTTLGRFILYAVSMDTLYA